jgi:hypothetical protein
MLTLRMVHFAPGDLLDISHLAGSDFIEPAPTTGDRRDKLGAGLGADRATILWRLGGRHHDLASPFHCRLRPWDVQNKSIMIQGAGRIAGRLCLELDRQLARLDLNADDVVADEVSVARKLGRARSLWTRHFASLDPATAALEDVSIAAGA